MSSQLYSKETKQRQHQTANAIGRCLCGVIHCVNSTYMAYKLSPNPQGSLCAYCGVRIFWAKTDAGKFIPLNTDMSPHFATCPNSARFRKKKNA